MTLIVLRSAPDLPADWMPEGIDGLWLDTDRLLPLPITVRTLAWVGARVTQTDRHETRDDGAQAEVWEVHPAPDQAERARTLLARLEPHRDDPR